jgi:hypothetical protein
LILLYIQRFSSSRNRKRMSLLYSKKITTTVTTSCKLVSTNTKLGLWKGPIYDHEASYVGALNMAVYDNVASFHSKIQVFILMSKRNKRFFWCCYPVVSVYWHVFIIEATQHVQSAVLPEQVLRLPFKCWNPSLPYILY